MSALFDREYARALVQDAPLYFMDEPFAAVDAATEQAIGCTADGEPVCR